MVIQYKYDVIRIFDLYQSGVDFTKIYAHGCSMGFWQCNKKKKIFQISFEIIKTSVCRIEGTYGKYVEDSN